MLTAAPKVYDWLRTTLDQRFPGERVEVVDTTGTDDHFQAMIISKEFDGLPTVKRHRLVYEALGDAMKERVHALSLMTLTPAEAEKRGGSS